MFIKNKMQVVPDHVVIPVELPHHVVQQECWFKTKYIVLTSFVFIFLGAMAFAIAYNH
jgi:hypothetical protein